MQVAGGGPWSLCTRRENRTGKLKRKSSAQVCEAGERARKCIQDDNCLARPTQLSRNAESGAVRGCGAVTPPQPCRSQGCAAQGSPAPCSFPFCNPIPALQRSVQNLGSPAACAQPLPHQPKLLACLAPAFLTLLLSAPFISAAEVKHSFLNLSWCSRQLSLGFAPDSGWLKLLAVRYTLG